MAGRLGVVITKAFVDRSWLVEEDLNYHLTSRGESGFAGLGVDLPRLKRSGVLLTRLCLDWSERRNHLGGALGRAVLDSFIEQGWLRRVASSRVLQLTDLGRQELQHHLGLELMNI